MFSYLLITAPNKQVNYLTSTLNSNNRKHLAINPNVHPLVNG